MASGHSPAFRIASWILLFSLHELGTQAAGNDLSLAREPELLALRARSHSAAHAWSSQCHTVSPPQTPSCCCGCCCYCCDLLPGEQAHVSPDLSEVIVFPTWPGCLVHLYIKICKIAKKEEERTLGLYIILLAYLQKL